MRKSGEVGRLEKIRLAIEVRLGHARSEVNWLERTKDSLSDVAAGHGLGQGGQAYLDRLAFLLLCDSAADYVNNMLLEQLRCDFMDFLKEDC